MRNSFRLFVAFGGAAILAGAAGLVACSDDTSVAANSDGGPDAKGDSFTPPVEAGGDTGTDAADFDGGFQVNTFDTVLASELCKSLARCCFGNPTPAEGGADGGTFDTNACINQFGKLGFEGSNIGAELKDGGKVVVDQVSADSCIKKIQGLSCNLTGAEFKAVRAACYGAYHGSGGAGATCVGPIECQQGFFCLMGDGGSSGTCSALRAVGAPCGDFTTNAVKGEEACSYRRGGGSGNYCSYLDVPSGTLRDAGDWKCTAAGGVGADCDNSDWCNESLCNFDTSKCETPERYLDGTCTQFVVP